MLHQPPPLQEEYSTRICAWCWHAAHPGVPVPTISSGMCLFHRNDMLAQIRRKRAIQQKGTQKP